MGHGHTVAPQMGVLWPCQGLSPQVRTTFPFFSPRHKSLQKEMGNRPRFSWSQSFPFCLHLMMQVSRRAVAPVPSCSYILAVWQMVQVPHKHWSIAVVGVQLLQHPRETTSGLQLNHHLPFDLPSVHRLGDKGLKQKFSDTNQKMSPL